MHCLCPVVSQSKHKVNTPPFDSKSRCTREDDECWMLVAKLVVGSWDLSTDVNQARNWARRWSPVLIPGLEDESYFLALTSRAIKISSDTCLANKMFLLFLSKMKLGYISSRWKECCFPKVLFLLNWWSFIHVLFRGRELQGLNLKFTEKQQVDEEAGN